MFATIPSVIQHIQAGKLRAIAVTSVKRSRSMPDVPTVADSGFPGFEAGSWFGFFAPKGTPEPVIATMNKAVNEVLPSLEAQLVREGADPSAARRNSLGSSCRRSSKSGAWWCVNPVPPSSDRAADAIRILISREAAAKLSNRIAQALGGRRTSLFIPIKLRRLRHRSRSSHVM